MQEAILNEDNLYAMLDSLLREPVAFWDTFYENRDKKVPFFENKPDENLVAYLEDKLIIPGRVLELGSGPGRNAIYLAKHGHEVDAIDLSGTSIAWAKERAREEDVQVQFFHTSLFQHTVDRGAYDLVYDSGCFHHIAPHRRQTYLDLVWDALKPGGHFALTCFIEGGELGGSDISDWDVYRQRSLNGGLGFTPEKLRAIFTRFEEIELRAIRPCDKNDGRFGVNGLWTVLFKKQET